MGNDVNTVFKSVCFLQFVTTCIFTAWGGNGIMLCHSLLKTSDEANNRIFI